MKLFGFVLLGMAYCQAPGNGVSKDTRVCSAGVIDSTYDFMTSYFPVEEADDDCRSRECSCGTQARVALSSYSIDRDNRTRSMKSAVERRLIKGLQVSSGFGLHCVYAAGTDGERYAEIGSKTQVELEAIFSAKFGSMNSYDVFMEYNTGLYTSDISSFVSSLDSDSIDYLTYSWSSGSNEYVSVVVHPPNTQIIHEVVGPSSNAPKHLLAKALKHEGARFSFRHQNGKHGPPEVASETMSALWVGRATTDVSRDKTYFATVFGLGSSAFVSSTGTDPNGKSFQMLEVEMSSTYTTKYRLVQPEDVNDGQYSVKWWEDYQNAVNAKYMTSPTCGWPLTGDNHNAFDWHGGFDQKTMLEGMDELNMPYFCKSGGRGGTHCYITTPYGYQIQLDGTYSDAPSYYSYPGSLCATYQEYC